MVLRRTWSVAPLLLAGLAFVGSSRLDGRVVPRSGSVARATSCPQLPSGAEPDVLESLVTSTNWAVSVTPKGSPASAFANTGGNTVVFTVQNTGGCPDTYTFSYTKSGSVTGVSLNPTSSYLPAGYSVNVTATYSVGAPGTGVLGMSAQGVSFNSGSYNVTVPSNGPVISLAPHDNDYRDVSKCIANCFDGVATYRTPQYFSLDTPHSVKLVYRSSQAHPMGMVQVDAIDTSSANPVKMSIQLRTSQGTLVTFTNGSREIFYYWTSHAADGNVNRLAAQFDASGLITGAYNYTLAVRSYRSDSSFGETDAPVRVLVDNEISSPFGAGWSLAGFQRLYPQSDGSLVIREGDGSIAWFTPTSPGCIPSTTNGCTYISPKGDVSTVNGGLYNNPCDLAGYRRTYDERGYDFYADGRLCELEGRMAGVQGMTYRYDASNRLVSIIDITGHRDTLGYSGNTLRWIQDPGSRTTFITIDASSNLTVIQDGGGFPFQGTYDANHLLTGWLDRRAGTWGLAYDFAGKIAADTAPPVTANGHVLRPAVRYASIEQRILANPGAGQGTWSNPAPTVDTAAVRASVTNARGFTTTYAFDRFGAPTFIQEPLGRTTTYVRDSNSNVLREAKPSGHVIRYTWSGTLPTQRWDSITGRIVNHAYDAHNKQVTLVYGNADTVINHWTEGNLDSSRIGGSGWTKYSYDSQGRVCTIVDPGGHTVTCHYTSTSGLENTDSTTLTLGRIAYQYDSWGQRVAVIDQVNDTTRTQYDAIGRTIATIGALHDTTSLTYDPLYLIQVRDAKGQVYRIWPNALGWADSTADPAGKVDRYQYDPNGNLTSSTNRNGQTIQYAYDSLDQVRSVVADAKTTTFFSDPAGHYQVASDSESVDTLRFDAADRPWLEISCRVLVRSNAPQCFRDSSAYETTSSQFGPRDLRTQIALSAPSLWSTQFRVGYHYDVHMLLDTLTPVHLNTQTGQPITLVYGVERLDSIRTLTGLNNLTITRTYPWTHRTDQMQLSDPALTAKLGTAYNFDNAGRMATRYHGSLANPDTTRSFSYGPRGDLVLYADSGHSYGPGSCVWFGGGWRCSGTSDHPWRIDSVSYVYDSVGNRKDPSAPNGGIVVGNRLARWQTFRMNYDAAGNMTAKRSLSATDSTKVLRTDSLFWSALGRLDSVRTRDSSGTLIGRVGFGYDGWGRRVRKSTASGTSRYIWDGDALLAQLDTLGNDVAGYTYYPGTDDLASVLRHDRGDSAYYYLQDNPKNVVALLARTSTGVTIDNQYRYDPFGNMEGNSGGLVPTSLLFAGREYDAETQLYYNRARFYDPALGRFISEDPLGLRAGINQYAYASNSPVNFSDPNGTSFLSWLGDVFGFVAIFVADWALPGVGFGTALLTATETIGAAALGSALAAGVESLVSGGSFWDAFEQDFGIVGWALAVDVGLAVTRGGGFVGAGANGPFQGYVQSRHAINLPILGAQSGGFTMGSGTLFSAPLTDEVRTSVFALLWQHELGHTIQFIGLSAFGKWVDPWIPYVGLGALGLTSAGRWWEDGASWLGTR